MFLLFQRGTFRFHDLESIAAAFSPKIDFNKKSLGNSGIKLQQTTTNYIKLPTLTCLKLVGKKTTAKNASHHAPIPRSSQVVLPVPCEHLCQLWAQSWCGISGA